MVQMIEYSLVHPKTPTKIVSEERTRGKVVVHQCQMAARPVAVEHSLTLDRSLEIKNMLLHTLCVFNNCLHHHRLIRAVLLVGGAVGRLNIVLVYVLQIGTHCLKEEGTPFLAPTIQ